MIEIASVNAMGKNKYGNLVENELQDALDSLVGKEKTEVINNGDTLAVKFNESNRYYEVDSDGNVENIQVVVDKYPGNIKLGINGETLTGDENSPYEIWCIEDLIELSNNYATYSNSYIKLCNNLDFKKGLSYANSKSKEQGDINEDGTIQTLIEEMQTGIGFTPINSFSGVLEGNELTISNLYINKESKSLALIASNKGTIKNLKIEDAYIHGTDKVGVIAGINDGTIDNCVSSGDFLATHWYTGGIAASNNGTLSNCVFKGSIKGSKLSYYIGGIVSVNKGTVSYCSNVSDIVGTFSNNSGGICSSNEGGRIEFCYNQQVINSIGNSTGGIVGSNKNGGIIKSCYNVGDFIGTNYNFGGICGANGESCTVDYCYNKGNISQKVYGSGGITGTNSGAVNYCYNLGTIAKGASIAGTNGNSIENCYYLKGLIADSCGIEKTEEEMQSQDFVDLLNLEEENFLLDTNQINGGYPILNWQISK